MSSPLSYRPDAPVVMERLRRFYKQRPQDVILAQMNPPSRAMRQQAHTLSDGYCSYPDPAQRVLFWDQVLHERQELQDDSIPSVYLSEMDQALYGGLVGGKAEFLCDPSTGWISSMVPPILTDLAQSSGLVFSQDHPWWKRYVHQMDVFAQAARGKFGISHFILINGLNFIFELVGATQTYIELLDRPELVREAMELAYRINLRVQQAFFEHNPLIDGGTCSFGWQWMPGRIISESVDPFHMTSVDYFEQWGRGTLERIYAKFDGGVVHIHGNGRHLLEAVSTIKGLKGIYLGDDRGYPKAFDILPQVRSRTGDLPLEANVSFPAFDEALREHKLTGGVFYLVKDVPDTDAANRCMDQVRRYRAG